MNQTTCCKSKPNLSRIPGLTETVSTNKFSINKLYRFEPEVGRQTEQGQYLSC